MSDPHFYSVTLKNWVAPWTNRDQNAFVPLNDYMVLVMGMVRDHVPFNQILSGDILYYGNKISTPVSPSNNDHYVALETAMHDPNFNPATDLTQTTQSSVYPVPSAATAGAITTRAAAQAFFVAGTNRAMFRFTLMNHLCMDMEQVLDTSVIPDRIRQDVSRSPGGDSRVFLNNCIGCHAGMDPMAQAFAYYNYDTTAGTIQYTAPTVQPKYFHNNTVFPDGFVTPDDAWNNHWRVRTERRARLVLRLAGLRQRREVDGPGARWHARVRAVPGHEGVPGGLPARARQRGRSRRGRLDDLELQQRLRLEAGVR